MAGLDFMATFRVSWIPLVAVADQLHPQSAACDLVLRVAHRALTEAPLGVNDLVPAEHRVNAALGRLSGDKFHNVQILVAHASLSVSRDVVLLAEDYDQLEREQRLADLAQAREFERLRRFRETVLRDPGTALAYRYMQNPSQDVQTLLDAPFDELIQRLGAYDPTLGWVQVAKLLSEIVGKLDRQNVEHLIWVLCELVSRAGHPEKRDAIKHYLAERE
ncbi:hypothetical protein [Polymorphospora sp. NPDC050346]|uniref:hypothetical protein n=1 Tax=Polymorphospora sp. NPDC050346 TaxID=3155780 RepID=UPI0033CD6A02